MAESNADRFLAAFKRIEHTLRQALDDAGRDTGYKTLISEGAKNGFAPVSTYQQRLITFGYLRNAIVHNPNTHNAEVIADPRTDVVREIEQIANNLQSPPTVDAVYQQTVYDVLGNCLVADVAYEMKERDFSQAPVITGDGSLRTLLTTNTIARWFAEAFHAGSDLANATIEEVLDYQESEDEYRVMDPTGSLFDVVNVFERPDEGHIPPYAAIITHDGSRSGKVKGIITPYDLPAVFSKLKPSHRPPRHPS
jgi:CBS domain-containing protein